MNRPVKNFRWHVMVGFCVFYRLHNLEQKNRERYRLVSRMSLYFCHILAKGGTLTFKIKKNKVILYNI